MRHKPNSAIVELVEKKKFPLASVAFYRTHAKHLMQAEYSRCEELLERRLPYEFSQLSGATLNAELMSKMKAVYSMVQRLEEPVALKLQRAAEDIIRDIYNVPEFVGMNSSIQDKDNIDLDVEQDFNPEAFTKMSPEDSIRMRDEIQKRIILNGFVHGSSMHIWKGAHYIIAETLEAINPSLVELYDEYVAIINFLLWRIDPRAMMHAIDAGVEDAANLNGYMAQGFNEVKFDTPGEVGATVAATGINFPVLLHELNKGVMDYLICRAVPSHLNEAELEYYYAKADDYKNEVWHYYMSPTLWAELLDTTKVQTQDLPGIMMQLSTMDLKELTQLCGFLIEDKDEARKVLGINEK